MCLQLQFQIIAFKMSLKHETYYSITIKLSPVSRFLYFCATLHSNYESRSSHDVKSRIEILVIRWDY